MRTAVAPSRLVNAFRAVLPTHATARAIPIRGRTVPVADVEVLGSVVHLVWAGEGWPRDIERAVAVGAARPGAVVVVKRMSPGAAAAAVAAGLGWVDEDGGADFTTPTLAVARTARPSLRPARPAHWTAQTMGVAEALLCGVPATVSAVRAATGSSESTCTRALALFADSGVLSASAARGRRSGRRLAEPDRLLADYAAYAATQSAVLELDTNPLWADIVDGVAAAGKAWDKARVAWAASGPAAAAVMAPLLTNVGSALVYVEADTRSDLEAAARAVGAVPVGGRGRLQLRAFPSKATRRLAGEVGGLRVAPWPRVYVDLAASGVRGDEAAEHLREVIADGRDTPVT